jgi:hypothetical protein
MLLTAKSGIVASKIGMISFVNPGLTEDFYIVQKEEFSITCSMCDTYACQKARHMYKRETHLLARADVK